MKLEDWTRDLLAEQLNSVFRLQHDQYGEIQLVLAEVSELKQFRNQQSFSLFFRGPNDQPLPQKMYRMSHAVLGEADLFIVPIGSDQQGLEYQAVFNRLLKPKV